jgi:hypothetical protein
MFVSFFRVLPATAFGIYACLFSYEPEAQGAETVCEFLSLFGHTAHNTTFLLKLQEVFQIFFQMIDIFASA